MNLEQTQSIPLFILMLMTFPLLVISSPQSPTVCQFRHQCSGPRLPSPRSLPSFPPSSMISLCSQLPQQHFQYTVGPAHLYLWLLIITRPQKDPTQKRCQHCWGVIQISSLAKLRVQWWISSHGLLPDPSEISLFFLCCNIGSNFCELIKCCAPLWEMAVNREIKL